MRVLTAILALGFGIACFPQQNAIDFSGGPSLTRLHGNNIFKRTDPFTGYQFNGGYTHWFKNGLGIQSQLTYASMGCELEVIGYDVFGVETIRDKTVYRFEYLGVSIGAAFRTPGRVHALVALGFMPSTIVGAEVNTPSMVRPEERYTLDLTAKAKNPVLFGYAAFGGAVDLQAPLTLGLMFRYDQGLTTLSRADFFETEDIIEKSWSFSLSLAYRWP